MILLFGILLFSHWVGDFVLQRHQWSLDKSSSNLALSKHVVVYTAAIFAGFEWAVLLTGFGADWGLTKFISITLVFALTNGIAHWIIDYFTSRLNKRLYAEGRVHDFFVSVGFDQFLHYAVMLGSLAVLM